MNWLIELHVVMWDYFFIGMMSHLKVMIIWNILCMSLVILSLSLIREVSSEGTVTDQAAGRVSRISDKYWECFKWIFIKILSSRTLFLFKQALSFLPSLNISINIFWYSTVLFFGRITYSYEYDTKSVWTYFFFCRHILQNLLPPD